MSSTTLSDKQNTLVFPYVRRQMPSLEDSLKLYLRDELQAIEKSIQTLADASIQVADAAPENPRKGMVRYAVSPWDPLSNGFSGLVVYNGTAWAAV